MTLGEAIDQLKHDRDLCLFNPTTGEVGEWAVSEDCRNTAKAITVVLDYIAGWDAVRKELHKAAVYHNGTDYARGIELSLIMIKKLMGDAVE